MLIVDPVSLYKDGEWRRIPAIDSQAWINAGWSLTETLAVEQNTKNPILSNELPPSYPKAEAANLQPEPTEVKVEQASTQLTPTENTKVETTKRKSSNQ